MPWLKGIYNRGEASVVRSGPAGTGGEYCPGQNQGAALMARTFTANFIEDNEDLRSLCGLRLAAGFSLHARRFPARDAGRHVLDVGCRLNHY